MPSPDSFQHYYLFGSTAPTGSSVYSPPASNTLSTLTDGLDGDGSDSMTDVGDQLTWSDDGSPVTLYGFNADGDPIIRISANDYYVLSDNPALGGTSVGTVTTTGTYTYCFLEGTQIDTADGPVPVETLAPGAQVSTADGKTATVLWLGRQTVRKLFAPAHIQPVRIRAGALGDGLPHSDLTVTADHGMVIDGLVINASALVNGGSIDWVPMAELPDRVTYFHVETESHDVILANGAPAETFIDYAGRAAFDNYQEYVELYGVERIVPEMHRPRISSRRFLPDAIKERLGGIKESKGFDGQLSA